MGNCNVFDWKSGRLATPNEAELFAIFNGLQENYDLLDSISEIHVFTDSVAAIKLAFDMSLHSAQ